MTSKLSCALRGSATSTIYKSRSFFLQLRPCYHIREKGHFKTCHASRLREKSKCFTKTLSTLSRLKKPWIVTPLGFVWLGFLGALKSVFLNLKLYFAITTPHNFYTNTDFKLKTQFSNSLYKHILIHYTHRNSIPKKKKKNCTHRKDSLHS